MNFSGFLSKSLALVCVLSVQQFAQAELVIMPIRPIQDLILVPGTDFNNSADEVLVENVTVEGALTFDSVIANATTINLTNGQFSGSGTDPRFGGGLTLTGGPDLMFGVLENVVRDPNHPDQTSLASIISAQMTFTVPNYRVRLEGLNIDLEVRDPFIFRAQLDGVPASNGTMYFADPLVGEASRRAVYVAGTNTIIGFSTNRRLVAVPEPSSLGLIGLALSGAGVFVRRRCA